MKVWEAVLLLSVAVFLLYVASLWVRVGQAKEAAPLLVVFMALIVVALSMMRPSQVRPR